MNSVINIHDIHKIDDVCCICLELPNNNNIIKLKCCNIILDKRCFFLLLINNYNTCPLCRTKINHYQYINKSIIISLYNQLSHDEKIITNEKFNNYLYNMSIHSKFVKIICIINKFIVKYILKYIFISFVLSCIYIIIYITFLYFSLT